jgi:predicted site-specific integrase-resolvase
VLINTDTPLTTTQRRFEQWLTKRYHPQGSPAKIEVWAKPGCGKRAVLYTRVSTGDQHPETQPYDLRELAKQRRYEIVHEYADIISGAKSKRPGLDQLLADARRHRFDVVLVGYPPAISGHSAAYLLTLYALVFGIG